MAFYGFNTNYSSSQPIKQLEGFSGFRIFIEGLTPVMVQDARGLGITGVLIIAENTTTGNQFVTSSAANGNALMQLDDNTIIHVEKDGLRKQVQYDNSGQFIITLQSNLLFA